MKFPLLSISLLEATTRHKMLVVILQWDISIVPLLVLSQIFFSRLKEVSLKLFWLKPVLVLNTISGSIVSLRVSSTV